METKFQANSNFILREIAGDYILVPTGDAIKSFNGLISLNETGAFLWNLLEQKRTLAELSEFMAKEYEMTAEECETDIREFLEPALEKQVVLRYS